MNRYEGTKLERARDLFEHALENCPAKFSKAFFLMYAKLEEDYGLARHALKIYDRALTKVATEDLYDVFTVYLSKAAAFFGIVSTREIYSKALEMLPDKFAREMAIKFATMETKLGEVDRARAIFGYGSQISDPRLYPDYWKSWHEFEVKFGNEDTYKEMLRFLKLILESNALFKRNTIWISITSQLKSWNLGVLLSTKMILKVNQRYMDLYELKRPSQKSSLNLLLPLIPKKLPSMMSNQTKIKRRLKYRKPTYQIQFLDL